MRRSQKRDIDAWAIKEQCFLILDKVRAVGGGVLEKHYLFFTKYEMKCGG